MRIKICGLTNEQDVNAAIEYGADALGFVLYPKSKRFVPLDQLEKLTKNLPPFVTTVAVMVNPTPEEIRRVESAARIDVWQLQGEQAPKDLEKFSPRRLIKAIGLPLEEGEADYNSFDAEALLFDKASPRYGGTGETFDWKLVLEIKPKLRLPFILAGGLNLKNVAAAINAVQPYGVDVCSGVEADYGKKDLKKLKEFIKICRH
jgi:phosphoribosylanthranilate isomerase